MKLSIVIVNYNVEHFLEQCLISVRKAIDQLDAEVFVVDNNSVDGSVSMIKNKFKDVKLIANKENDVFIAKTVQYEENNINKNSTNFEKISSEEGAQSKNNILKSYDLFLNNRYQVVVNEKTLARVKNYFK